MYNVNTCIYAVIFDDVAIMNDYIEQLLSYNYISFDVFDTLIFRTVPKTNDQLKLIPYIASKVYGINLRSSFVNERTQAERIVRNSMQGREITIDQIYSEISNIDTIRDLLIKIECDIEVENCVGNKIMIDILNKCWEFGKKIIITTDMYLPRIVFERILNKIGVHYDYLFISSEEGETKRTGKLFPIVLGKLGIKASQLLHIGDDPNNDIYQARRNGIKAIERIEGTNMTLPYLKLSNKNNPINDHLYYFLKRGFRNPDRAEHAYKVGYTVVGPFLWDFCKWLHRMKQELHLNRLLFVAREGFLIKKCYDCMYPDETDLTDYIKLNKNLLRLPMLSQGDIKQNLFNLIPSKQTFTWSDIFRYLSISDENKAKNVIKAKNPSVNFSKSIKRLELLSGKYDIELDSLIDLQQFDIKNQECLLFEYLIKKGIMKGRVGLVNNSINGNAQNLIQRYLFSKKIETSIYGLQFLRNEICKERLGHHCRAWITENDENRFMESRLMSTNSLVLEHLMFEPSGTAICFERDIDGNVITKCEEVRKEKENFPEIRRIHDATIQFVKDYSNNMQFMKSMDGYHIFMNFLLHPQKEDAELICNLWDDDIGGDRYISDLSMPIKLKYILAHNLSPNISWWEGYYAAKGVPFIFKRIFEFRLKCKFICRHK